MALLVAFGPGVDNDNVRVFGMLLDPGHVGEQLRVRIRVVRCGLLRGASSVFASGGACRIALRLVAATGGDPDYCDQC